MAARLRTPRLRGGLAGRDSCVGAANGANQLQIIIPCHWVVGCNGALTGFGGGLGAKDYMLSHEQEAASLRGRVDRLGPPSPRIASAPIRHFQFRNSRHS